MRPGRSGYLRTVSTTSDAGLEAFLASVTSLLGTADATSTDTDPGGTDDGADTGAADPAPAGPRALPRPHRDRSAELAEQVAGLRRRFAALAAEVTPVPHANAPRVEQARGMLMLALGLDEDDAGLCLHLLAWRSGTGPEAVAQRLVSEGVQAAARPGGEPTEPAGEQATTAPAVVRRALRFIDEHAAEPVGIEDIAAAAGIGSRGLQLAFRRHVGATPTDQLRRVRLERARRDLEAGDTVRGDTVAGIATRWGFAHHGRFAIDYRRAFGCSPSHTLRH